ncbi:MAG: hypothetical protein QGI35_08750, partial [Arenicellales bacterium]|nr:hypothetical protein [Arenicellales bacterium]
MAEFRAIIFYLCSSNLLSRNGGFKPISLTFRQQVSNNSVTRKGFLCLSVSGVESVVIKVRWRLVKVVLKKMRQRAVFKRFGLVVSVCLTALLIYSCSDSGSKSGVQAVYANAAAFEGYVDKYADLLAAYNAN